MADYTFILDEAGGSEVLKMIVAEEIGALAARVSAAAGPESVITMKTTDRARASVSVPADSQAKDGLLSKAAAGIGLQITPSKKRAPRPRKQRADSKTRRKKTDDAPAQSRAKRNTAPEGGNP